MKTLYVMCGVPGLGKSSWVNKHWRKLIGYTTVVSRDDIRFSLISEGENYFSKEHEVFHKFISDIKAGLEKGDNVIADATHINEASRNKLLRSLGDALKGVKVVAVVIDGSVEEAIEHNEKRRGTRSYVPETAIRRMYSQFTMPSEEEGFNEIYIINKGM